VAFLCTKFHENPCIGSKLRGTSRTRGSCDIVIASKMNIVTSGPAVDEPWECFLHGIGWIPTLNCLQRCCALKTRKNFTLCVVYQLIRLVHTYGGDVMGQAAC